MNKFTQFQIIYECNYSEPTFNLTYGTYKTEATAKKVFRLALIEILTDPDYTLHENNSVTKAVNQGIACLHYRPNGEALQLHWLQIVKAKNPRPMPY